MKKPLSLLDSSLLKFLITVHSGPGPCTKLPYWVELFRDFLTNCHRLWPLTPTLKLAMKGPIRPYDSFFYYDRQWQQRAVEEED